MQPSAGKTSLLSLNCLAPTSSICCYRECLLYTQSPVSSLSHATIRPPAGLDWVTCAPALPAPTERRSTSRATPKKIAGPSSTTAPSPSFPLPFAHSLCSHAEGHPAHSFCREAGSSPRRKEERQSSADPGDPEPARDETCPRNRGPAAQGGRCGQERGLGAGSSGAEARCRR